MVIFACKTKGLDVKSPSWGSEKDPDTQSLILDPNP